MIGLAIFFIILIVIGVFDLLHIKRFDQFIVAGRNQSQPFVLMSVLASIIGASSTLGVANLAYNYGFPAFWWLGAGSIGLFLQGFLISKKIRSFNCFTLPHLANEVAGEGGKLITAIIIVVSWLGIIAAQFVALSDIIAIISGNPKTIPLLIVTSLVIVLYTVIGGQLSILKTDALQFIMLIFGLLFCFIYLFFFSSNNVSFQVFSNIQLLNSQLDFMDLVYFLFIIGGSFFIGPDIFSRNFTAKDGNTAKTATIKAGFFLLFIGLLITLIGMWAKEASIDTGKSNVLIYIIENYLPKFATIILAFGLLAAIISSADTCIITTAAILENDILKKHKVKDTRIFAAIIGIIALIIALFKKNIVALLLYGYSIFTPGIVIPLFLALHFYKKRQLNIKIWILAIIIGGCLGLMANIFNIKPLALVGMSFSSLISFFAFPANVKKEL